jgi:hypothetical protein
VTFVTKFRIAGQLNEGAIKLELFRCGWNSDDKTHVKENLFSKQFDGPTKAFEYTVPLDGTLDSQYEALSLVIHVTKKTSISLIAVEFGHPS